MLGRCAAQLWLGCRVQITVNRWYNGWSQFDIKSIKVWNPSSHSHYAQFPHFVETLSLLSGLLFPISPTWRISHLQWTLSDPRQFNSALTRLDPADATGAGHSPHLVQCLVASVTSWRGFLFWRALASSTVSPNTRGPTAVASASSVVMALSSSSRSGSSSRLPREHDGHVAWPFQDSVPHRILAWTAQI
jgi:hypothetical protein